MMAENDRLYDMLLNAQEGRRIAVTALVNIKYSTDDEGAVRKAQAALDAIDALRKERNQLTHD